MNISELFKIAEIITNSVSDIDKTISELKEELEGLEKKHNKDTEKIKQLKEVINEEKDKLEDNKTRLSEILAEIMKYREIRVIFEEQVKDEIQERCEPYTAVNNIYRELVKNVMDDLDEKYKNEVINISDINNEYDKYFKDYSKILQDLEAGKTTKHDELCKLLNSEVDDKIGGYVEKYKYLKTLYEEKINLYNYRMYNQTIDAKTKFYYTQIQKEDARTKYEPTIEQLINNQTQRIEEIAKNLDNNEALKMGIEKYFKFHKCDEKKGLLDKDDLASKKQLIEYLIKQYADIPVRQDMTKRENVYTTAMKDVDARIKELQKEYGNSKEEKEVKSDNLNIEGINVEENTHTVTISQEELKKIYENRTKQTIEKKEEKENISKTFFNSIKGKFIKIFSKEEDIEEKDKTEEKLETETDNKQKEDIEEKDKAEEKLETETVNKQKEEQPKELSENDKKFIDNHPEYVRKMLDILLKEEVTKEVDPVTKKAEKEQDDKDEIER